jgi:hypothetical protein
MPCVYGKKYSLVTNSTFTNKDNILYCACKLLSNRHTHTHHKLYLLITKQTVKETGTVNTHFTVTLSNTVMTALVCSVRMQHVLENEHPKGMTAVCVRSREQTLLISCKCRYCLIPH